MGKPSMMNTKERLLYYLDKKGVNKSAFFKGVGLSRTNFTGTNLTKSLSSDALVKVLTHCPDLSAEWLMRGEGGMLRQPLSTVQLRSVLRPRARVKGEKLKGASSGLTKAVIKAAQAAVEADEKRAVRAAVESLPENLRMVIQLKEYSGLDYKSIAKVLGISETNVKVRVYRARKKLEEALSTEDRDVY